MVISFAHFRSIFYACQTESAVAICSNSRSVPARRMVDPQAGILKPPPSQTSSLGIEQEGFYPPSSRKNTTVSDPALNKAFYDLDGCPGMGTQSSKSIPFSKISPESFLSYLQQKYRDSRKFICIDLSNLCLVKFALPLSDMVLANVTSDVTILLLGHSDGAYDTLASMLPTAPRQILALSGSVTHFLDSFPFCYTESFFTMPGPTIILRRPEKGFSLYVSDFRTAKTCVQMLQEVFDIRYILNLSCTELASHYADTEVSIVDLEFPPSTCRGNFYYRALTKLLELASCGLPVLLCDMSGYCHAPAVAALFLVLMGWTPNEVLSHVCARRGEICKRKQLIDNSTTKAMRACLEHVKLNGASSLPTSDIFADLYLPMCDDVQNNDLALAREMGIYRTSL